MSDFYLRGRFDNGSIRGRLKDGNHRLQGTFKGERFKGELPLRDYPALTEQVLDTIAHYLYDPELLESKEWRKFSKQLRSVSGKIRDDLGMLMAFQFLSQDLPFSHIGLSREQKPAMVEQDTSNATNHVSIDTLTSNSALMKVRSFSGSSMEMNKAFRKVKALNPEHLVIDLRNNYGGSIEAGMTFVKQLMDTTRYGGVFLTRNYFRSNNSLPDVQAYSKFPVLEKGSYDLLFHGIHNYEGICLKVKPVQEPYRGRVYILTSNRTASTCEPIVYGLKHSGNAMIVGEKTAGAMLSAESFPLVAGYKVILPTATYYTVDGYKIDQNGVKPDVEVEAGEALEYVLNRFINPQEGR